MSNSKGLSINVCIFSSLEMKIYLKTFYYKLISGKVMQTYTYSTDSLYVVSHHQDIFNSLNDVYDKTEKGDKMSHNRNISVVRTCNQRKNKAEQKKN